MADTLQFEDLKDMVELTHESVGPMNQITNMAQEYTNLAISRILATERVSTQSGNSLRRFVNTGENDNAEHVGPHHTDNINIVDTANHVDSPWSKLTSNTSWDVDEFAMNRDPERMVDEYILKYSNMMEGVLKKMEIAFWSKPATSATKNTPHGIPQWVVKSATADVGFNGGDPAGFTSGAGGLDIATYPKWQNSTGTITSYTDAGMLDQMRSMHIDIGFQKIPMTRWYTPSDKYRIYTTKPIYMAMGKLIRSQNENLGRDLNAMGDEFVFNGAPITHVPYLTKNDSDNPIYFINFGYFEVVWLKGRYMVVSKPGKHPTKHDTVVQFVDNVYAFICRDRKRQGVLYKA